MTTTPATARLIRSEHRFEPPEDHEPVAVSRPGVTGSSIAFIYPGDAELSVVVHSAVGVSATVTGSQLHEPTSRRIRTTTLSRAWSDEERGGFDPLSEAPEWVRDAVEQVTR